MKKLLLPTLLLLLVLAFSACAEKPTPVGEYNFLSVSIERNGVTHEYKVGDKILGAIEISEDAVTLSVKKDGTYDLESSLSGYAFSDKGKWESKGDAVVFHSSSADVDATSDGDELILDYNGDDGKTNVRFVMRRG